MSAESRRFTLAGASKTSEKNYHNSDFTILQINGHYALGRFAAGNVVGNPNRFSPDVI
jgi:hypothetical protein